MTKNERVRKLLEENRDVLLNGEKNNGICFDGLVDEKIYDEQEHKVVVLLKETNGDDFDGNKVEKQDDFDYIAWLKKQQVNNELEWRKKGDKEYLETNVFYYSTFRKLCYWLSLLFDELDNGKVNPQKFMTNGQVNIPVVRQVLNNVGVINLKKSWGRKQTNGETLSEYVLRTDNIKILREQMNILSPQIILCCSPAVFELATQVYANGVNFFYEEPSKTISGKNVEFAIMNDRVYVNFYHPQYYGKTDEVFSNYAVETFEHLHNYLKMN